MSLELSPLYSIISMLKKESLWRLYALFPFRAQVAAPPLERSEACSTTPCRRRPVMVWTVCGNGWGSASGLALIDESEAGGSKVNLRK